MSRRWWNPAQSDYTGRYRLAAIALVIGAGLTVVGFGATSEVWRTLLPSAGVGLLIGAGAVALSAWRSRQRARLGRGS